MANRAFGSDGPTLLDGSHSLLRKAFLLVCSRKHIVIRVSLTSNAAQFVSAAAVIASNGMYEIEPWKTYLIFLAILTFTTGANIFGNKILGRWNDAACELLRCLPLEYCTGG